MSRIESYRAELRRRHDWDDYLRAESRLPGPRANLELLEAVVQEGDEARFRRYAALASALEAANTPDEFLTVCGIVGLGRLVAEGRRELMSVLRELATDARWRIREAVAMALQHYGDADMAALLDEMTRWARGGFLEQRAAVAALCEPRLLARPENARRVLGLLDEITGALQAAPDRHAEPFRVLRQALGYGWSVAVVALPEEGKRQMSRWLNSLDRDIRWVMKQNLGKSRLQRLDPSRVAEAAAMMDAEVKEEA